MGLHGSVRKYGHRRSKMLIIEALKTMVVINVELHIYTANITVCNFNVTYSCYLM